MWWNPFAKSDLPETELELEDRRLRQRRIILIAVSAIVLLGIGLLSARPAVNQVSRMAGSQACGQGVRGDRRRGMDDRPKRSPEGLPASA